VITIEGIRVRAESIPKKRLISKWQQLSAQPFPRVKAYQLKDDDFNRVMALKRCEEDELRELQEWNTILTTKGTDACVFKNSESASSDYMILIREKPYHGLDKIIEHELLHIVRRDL
jgi:hypothetical protein